MKTFFIAFQLNDRTLVRAKECLDMEILEMQSFEGGDGDGDDDSDSSEAMLSSGFQNLASFLLLLIVVSTSYLLHIPQTVTFC